MQDDTHALIGTQRTVRAIRKVAADEALSAIAGSKQLATVHATSPFTIILDGSTVAVAAHHLSSYTPTISDRVLVDIYAKQFVVLGTFV